MRSPKRTLAPAAAGAAARLLASAQRTLEAEASGIAAVAEALRADLGEAFAAAVTLMQPARGRVIVTGMGKSGHVARKIAATLASTGTPAFFVHPGEASHGDLGMITPDDVVMALSWSGETAELRDLIDYSRRFRIGLIAVTAAADSTLAKAADVALLLPQAREACPHNLAPTTSSLMQLVLGDALAVALLEARGFTATQFGALHPGGRLGAMLKFVRHLMHTGEAVPRVRLGADLAATIAEMSAKGFGCAAVIDAGGRLAGIVTDGDLRRHLARRIGGAAGGARVDDVMTRTPKTIGADDLASEALELLNSAKITALLVVEDSTVVGILHLHDLLRAGVA